MFEKEIETIVVGTATGMRKGVGQMRRVEFKEYLQDLIDAKAGGLDLSTIQFPMLSDRVRMQISAALSAKTKAGAEGGIEWSVIKIAASYSKEQQTGVSVTMDMEFVSPGAPDFDVIKTLSVDELKKLLEIVEED